MTDDRFFPRCGPFSLGLIADMAKAESAVPRDCLIRGIAPLDRAEPDELSVFCDPSHAAVFATTRAGAVITTARLAERPHNGTAVLVVRDPRYVFAQIGLMFYPRCAGEPGISTGAHIDPSAVIAEGCRIDAGAVIGPNVRVGTGSHIGANAVLCAAVEIGSNSVVASNASLSCALVGNNVRIGSGTVIGGEGFGVVLGPTGLMCSAQVGRVVIGDNVRIGGNCTIDRGAVGDTVIGAGTMIDNLVQIAHNVRIGRNCIFAGQAGVAGSTTIGDNVMVGGAVSISDHLVVGSNARIAGKSGVMRDVGDGETVAGYPAVPVRQWHRQTSFLAKVLQKAQSCAEPSS
jgi:UDP-3-O-[3-hydroxymyristoyl] glucosamine N-acyltransferase